MDNIILSGKAKTVFQMIELMAKGEELKNKRQVADKQMKLNLDNTYQLWPSTK